MKIRIKGDSVRYRLTMSEVDQLMNEGSVEETTEFNENVFGYTLTRSAWVDELTARFTDNRIELILPVGISENWHTNSQVGFENTLHLKNGKILHLLIEKDFVCLDETTEDQSDNYPNPKANMSNG